MGFGKTESATNFTSILRKKDGDKPAGANFHELSSENTEGAVMRTNKNGRDVWELVHPSVTGIISKMWFKTHEKYGKSLVIVIDGIPVQMGTDDKFFTDFAKKFPRINLKKEVSITPFFFQPESKEITGLSIQQDGDKLQNYYYDGKKNLHGFPEPEGDKSAYVSDDWKIYFMQVKKFLIKEVETLAEKSGILGADKPTSANQAGFEEKESTQEVTAEDLPF